MSVSLLPKSLITEMDTHPVVDYQPIRRWGDGPSTDFNFLLRSGSWQYRGEGNANIVVAVAVDEGVQVLRLQKMEAGDQSPSQDWIRERRNLEREVVIANKVFGPLIGPEFVGTVQIVKLNLSLIDDLNAWLKNLRPANRLHKELGVPYATSHTDLAMIYSSPSEQVNYCVEIKPKQGWWTKNLLGEPTNLCSFCLNQFLKIKIGKVTGRSAYCPLDLFSGDPLRLVGAILALIRTPQNNFRIFRNGELVYGENNENESLEAILREWFGKCENFGAIRTLSSENERYLVNFVYLISKSLLKPLDPVVNSSSAQVFHHLKTNIRNILLESFRSLPSDKEEGDCNAQVQELPDESILFRILRAQKLGKRGSGSIYKLYPRICPVHASSSESTESESSGCPSSKCLVADTWMDEISSHSLTDMELICIEHYLLATTAKDFSIMITFSPLTHGKGDRAKGKDLIQDLGGNYHKFKMGVADLAPKPVTSIARHYMRDIVMLEAYQRYLSQNRSDS